MKKPLVSVITPAYNCEQYIEESIGSIFSQKFKNFELIIVNDGSTDNTAKIVSDLFQKAPDWLSERFVFIDRQTNHGCFKTRTEAIKLSDGKYIAIHDADDISLSNRLEKQYIYLKNWPEIWCVGSVAITIDENGKKTGIWDYPPEKHEMIIKSIQGCKNPIIDPSTMFRRDVFLKIGGYSLRDDRILVDDMDLWLRSILKGYKIYNFQKPLIKYRINQEGNTLKHKKKMIKQHMIVWREFIKGFQTTK